MSGRKKRRGGGGGRPRKNRRPLRGIDLVSVVEDLIEAQARYFRRVSNLFENDRTPKHSPEEMARRLVEYREQFEAGVRPLESRIAEIRARVEETAKEAAELFGQEEEGDRGGS